jgi:cytochrome c1
MINSVMTFKCDECHGEGLIFWGNDKDYSVEPCQCQMVSLFNTREAE